MYEVALSFAGEQRTYVDEVAQNLQLRRIPIFYDVFERVQLWGKHLSEELQAVYEDRARLVVMFISTQYVENVWPRVERKAILNRAAKEPGEYILPVRFDDVPVPGLSTDLVYLQAKDYSPAELAAMIAQKLGVGPFDRKASDVPPPTMTSLAGKVAFDYSDFNGRYVIGNGLWEFETKWSKASNQSIHIYNDPRSIHGVALGPEEWTDFGQVTAAKSLNYTSRSRRLRVGRVVVLCNSHGFYAALRVLDIKDNTRGDDRDEVRFRYVIQPNGQDDFSDLPGF